MAQVARPAQIIVKGLKLLINIIVVALYRVGDGGRFMGASYNKNHDAETLTTGIFIGFLIYNFVGFIALLFDRYASTSILEGIMNFIGAVMWITTGAVILQFWHRFMPDNHFTDRNPKDAGLSMGSLAIINSFVYFGETVISYYNYSNSEDEEENYK